MSILTVPEAERLDHDAATLPVAEIAAYLQRSLGQQMAAFLAGLSDVKQIGRYAREDGPEPRAAVACRLRHGYKIVRMIGDAYDAETAKAWLVGTNTRLDDQAPIELLRAAKSPEEFTAVVRAARQLASFQT
ncbi:MAG TPA: hypothetical protein VIC06_09600 [Solirubrobacteraceae bacterium]|jgi:hypothetical protein